MCADWATVALSRGGRMTGSGVATSHLSLSSSCPILTRVATTPSDCCCGLGRESEAASGSLPRAASVEALLCKLSSTRGQQASSAKKSIQESKPRLQGQAPSIADRESGMHSTVCRLKCLHKDCYSGPDVSHVPHSNSHARVAIQSCICLDPSSYVSPHPVVSLKQI